MTDDQAERSIRELRAIKATLFFVAGVLAIYWGLRLGEAFSNNPPPPVPLEAELKGVQKELELLRTELERQRNTHRVDGDGKSK